MIEITEEEFKQFQALKRIWTHLNAERTGTYFICGEGGDKDTHGLPQTLLVCPQHGLDSMAAYELKTPVKAPEW